MVAVSETRKKGTNIVILKEIMKQGFWICFGFLAACPVSAQKLKRADRVLAAYIAADIAGLGRDSASVLSGPAAPRISVYVAAQFEQMGMGREGDSNSYFRAIRLDKGKIIGTACALSLDGQTVVAGTEFYPLAGSPDGHVEGNAGISLNERGLPWIYDLKYDLETGRGSAGFDLHKLLERKALEARKKGATALLLYNSSAIPDELAFDGSDRSTVYAIPVVYIKQSLSGRVFKDATAYVDVNLTVSTENKASYVHDVEGFINNGAHRTVILRASLDTSGCAAALIELARLVKQAGWKRHNYLVLGYSGESSEACETPLPSLHPGLGKDSVDYSMVVESNYLHVRYGNDGMGKDYPLVAALGMEGPASRVVGTDYNREALSVRYIFKLMEAAEKQ